MAAAKWEPPKLDLGVERYNAFKSWKQRWKDYSIVTKLNDESAEYKCSMLRYTFSDETQKIYETLGLTDDEEKDVNIIINKLETFAKGTVNETMERHIFNSRDQQDGEPFDDFLTEIKILSKNCNFCQTCHDGLIRDRIVGGIQDPSLRQKLLSDDKLSLKKCEEACRAREKAKEGGKLFSGKNKSDDKDGDVDAVHGRFDRPPQRGGSSNRGGNSNRGGGRGGYNNNRGGRGGGNAQPKSSDTCKFCVHYHKYGRSNCHAWGKPCNACGEYNHFKESEVCKKNKTVRNVNTEDEGQDESIDFLYFSEVVEQGSDEDEETTTDEEIEEAPTDEEEYFSCTEGEPVEATATTSAVAPDRKKKRRRKRRGQPKSEPSHVAETVNQQDRENVFLSQVEAAQDDDQYFSCSEEIPDTPPKRRTRRRGPRKPKESDDDNEQDALLCPLANSSTNNDPGLSWEIHMPGTNGEIHFKIDTGADVTVIPEEELPKLGLELKDVRETRKKLFGPGKQRLKCRGYVKTLFTWGDITDQQIVYVCRGIKRALLGKPAIRRLKIVELNLPKRYSCAEVIEMIDEQEMDEVDNEDNEEIVTPDDYPLLKEFPQLYNRLGKIDVGGPVNIKVKEGTIPHQTYSPRHIPLPLMKKVIAELKKMEKLEVIRKIDKPTAWCHPIVVVVKPNGDIRLCVDLTKLNAGVERELHHLESVEETLAKLGDECIYMTKVDANSGYWQVLLDEESQELTTFITPLGRFCCTRGPYGLSSMQEIFGKKMDIVIEGLEGVAKSTDDFLVFAKTKDLLQKRTRKLFQRFLEHGVTINLKKCAFEKTKMDFVGHRITSEGILPLTSKMEAIEKFARPQNIKELRRFMGMANQMAKFNPNLAEASAPLRSLLSTKSQWVWTAEHTDSFKKVKSVIMSPQTLKLYDVSRPTKLRVDGSKLNGVSCVLYQQHGENWHPVTCGSRYLTPAEKNWYPIENEMLAVTWGCRKMNMYLQGLPHFLVETDHKPLIPILNTKQLTEMSPRIQEMRMKLLRYTFTADHVPGAKMEDADALSRAPHEQPTDADIMMDEEISCHVNEVIKRMPATTAYIDKVKRTTASDKELQKLGEIMMRGWPKSKQLCPEVVQPFWDSRHDLTVVDGLFLKGDRIVIPKTLQRNVLDKLHNAHQGMDRTKRRARQSCYWPKMNSEIEAMVKGCSTCLKHKPSKPKEALQPRSIPSRPWEKIGTDLFELAGKPYIVITDYYSLYPEVYELKEAKSRQVIAVMKDTFSRHGIPTEVVSDNGSQYKSHCFRQFAKEWDFQHNTSSPRYPQSNGLAESSVKTVKSMMKKCLATKKDIKQGLLSIRNTPLACGASPAELLMNRQLNDILPRLPAKMNTNEPSKRNMMAERTAQKEQHDKKVDNRRTADQFHAGQRVALQDPASKLWTDRGRIVKEVAPRSFEVKVDGKNTLRRNTRHLRKLHSTTSTSTRHEPIESEDEDIPATGHEPIVNDDEDFYSDSDSSTSTIPYEEDMDAHESLVASLPRSRRTVHFREPTDYEDL